MNRLVLPIVGLVFFGCASGQGRGVASGPAKECGCASKKGQAGPTEVKAPAAPAQQGLDHGKAAVPVSAADPSWGSPDAPVTIVEWSDFECPFCSRVGETLAELKRWYGPEQIRLVWKNLPLSFHAHARPAAEAAMTVFALGGGDAFWKFHDLVFANQQELTAENYAAWAAQAGVDGRRFEEAMQAPRREREDRRGPGAGLAASHPGHAGLSHQWRAAGGRASHRELPRRHR